MLVAVIVNVSSLPAITVCSVAFRSATSAWVVIATLAVSESKPLSSAVAEAVLGTAGSAAVDEATW